MKRFATILGGLLCCVNAEGEETFVHLSEGVSEEQAQAFLENIDTGKIKDGVEERFPTIKEHPAEFKVEILIFTSAISGNSRPVYRIQFETVDDWEGEQDFVDFFAENIREQIPSEYFY